MKLKLPENESENDNLKLENRKLREQIGLSSVKNEPLEPGKENIILQGENQNMTVDELHKLLVAECTPIMDLRKELGDEKAAEAITERRETCKTAIRKLMISVQACQINLNDIKDKADERVKKALYEYDKKYKPSIPKTIKSEASEKLTKQEKMINELQRKFGFSKDEAESMLLKRVK